MLTTATVIDLEAPDSWPGDLRTYLSKHHALFLDWATGATHVPASAYDRAIYGLRDVLQQYAITGWHCTRLTPAEMATIAADGMQLPDAAMLSRRIDALQGAGLVTDAIAERLKADNLADARSRAGMVWF